MLEVRLCTWALVVLSRLSEVMKVERPTHMHMTAGQNNTHVEPNLSSSSCAWAPGCGRISNLFWCDVTGLYLDDFSSPTQHITRPLIAPQEHRTPDTDPHRPRSNTTPEHPPTLLAPNPPRQRENTLSLPRQHHPRLQHIQRRRQSRRNGAGNSPVYCRLRPCNLLRPPLRRSLLQRPLLQRLPQRKLNNRKRHLAHNRNAPPAIQLPPDMRNPKRSPLSQHELQRRRATRKLLRLRPTLDHLGRHSDRTSRDLPHRCAEHVRACAIFPNPLLHALIADEEERCARGGAYYDAADAGVNSSEAAGGPEAGGGLQAGFERVERVEGDVDCRAC